jgi:hypothetical protein
MSIEDRVREAMRAHEHEAPTAAEFSASRGLPIAATTHRRRTGWLAAAPAAACVLVVAAVIAIVRPTGDKPAPSLAANPPVPVSPPLACPQRYETGPAPWVPRPPTVADAGHRLVPDRTPAHVVVCAYLARSDEPNGNQTVLTGRRELGGDLAAVRTTLTWLPERVTGQQQPCLDYLAPTDGDNYLIGLSYRGGTVWVSAPGNHCDDASNGPFTTMVNLRPWAAAAIAAGAWLPHPPQRPTVRDSGPCGDNSVGRVGQGSAMVPAGATSVAICVALSSAPHAGQRTVTSSGAVGGLAQALNRSPTQVSTSACVGDGHQQQPYELVFRYADGPAVHVRVDAHCRPAIDNGSLQAADAGSVVPLIEQSLGRH